MSTAVVLVAVRAVLSPARSEAVFGRARAVLDWAFARLLPPLVLIAAVLLLIGGTRRLVSP